MGILYNRLLIVINDENPDSTAYHIAITMLKHIEKICTMAINEIAELCSVSKSTISKFIRILGYEDYAEFRYASGFRENKYQNNTNYVTNVMGYLESNPMDKYINAVQEDIAETYRFLDWNAIDRLVADLVSYEKVAAFGLMFSETAALDLQTKLAYNKKFIITNLNDRKQDYYIQHAGEDTLIIVFTNSGEYINKYSMIDDFVSKKVFDITRAKVVAITSNEEFVNDPRVSYCILFKNLDMIHTHRIVYSVLTDIISFKYREYIKRIR